MDWEFPLSHERDNFVALHKAIKDKFQSSYLLTTAVIAGNWQLNTNKIYDYPALAKSVDFINLMTYDYHADASWDLHSGVFFNAPVKVNDGGDSVENGINLWIKGGAPASKLTVGVPFYARVYQLASASQNTPGSKFNGGLQQSDVNLPPFNAYCKKINDPSWTKKRDTVTLCSYMHQGNSWIAYEDEQSIIDKGKLAVKYNLGGVMLWSLNQDDYDGVCSTCKWPLLKALNSAIDRSSSCSGTSAVNTSTNPTIFTTTTQKITTTTTSSANPRCSQAGYFPHPADCVKYLVCTANGALPIVMSCAPGTYWNTAGHCGYTCVQ